MPEPPLDIALSPKDSERFGFPIARVFLERETDLDETDAWCAAQGVRMLIGRCSTHRIGLAQLMERRGYSLMDTLVYYTRTVQGAPLPTMPEDLEIRPVLPAEAERVREVAGRAFSDYISHYHADPRLDPGKCEEVFIDWAYQSCVSREVADEVYVADVDGLVRGFATLKVLDAHAGEGVLFAVHPEVQRRGLYRAFMLAGMHWFRARAIGRMVVSTQVNNTAVQKAWTRLGFEPLQSRYTFHKWYD